MKSLYKLYRNLGEPCTIRTFLSSVRPPPHYSQPQPVLVEDDNPTLGKNAYVFGDEITFTSGNRLNTIFSITPTLNYLRTNT